MASLKFKPHGILFQLGSSANKKPKKFKPYPAKCEWSESEEKEKGEREGRSEKRRREEEERTKRKRKEERDKSKVCREEKSKEERKTQTKRGRGKRREKLAEGREETEEEESVFFGPLLGIIFPLLLGSEFSPKLGLIFSYLLLGPQKKLANGWQSMIFFLLYLGLQQRRPIVCGQILCFLLLGPPIFWQNWNSLFCFHALGPSILSLQKFTKSYGYALVLFTILG